MRHNHAVSPRKKPVQARAQATVEAILDAATHVLVSEGYEGATTNRIAARAGVSIGSLYQYFPTKEAIVAALIEQHEATMLQQLAEMAIALQDEPIEEAVRTYVKAMLAAHALEPKLHAVLTGHMSRLLDLETLRAMQSRVEQLVRAYLEKHRAKLRPKNLDLATFVLTTAVEAVTHVAVIDRAEMLRQPALADEISELILRFLLKRPVSRSRRASKEAS